MANAEPTLSCPKCGEEIKLNESLAAPLLEGARKEFNQQLEAKDKQVRKQREELAESKAALEDEISTKVREARSQIVEEESKKARQLLKGEIDRASDELSEMQTQINEKDERLAEAQKSRAELMKKGRELEAAKQEMDLTVETKIQEGLAEAKAGAVQDAENRMSLKVREKEETITSMQTKIEELRRKAEQGSQQMQGEVQELVLEELFTAQFPYDEILPVPKGEHGGDIIHKVSTNQGKPCGSILWEIKRTKSWSDLWLTKLRNDQRAAKADVAVIVSQVLPKGVETFELIDNVWVVSVKAALPIATILRHSLMEVHRANASKEGMQTKAEIVYEYLTGPQFRRRVEAIVEAFSSMNDDLAKEKKAITKQWAKRETQIDRVMQSTVGMYGDLTGIASGSMEEIEGLGMLELSAP